MSKQSDYAFTEWWDATGRHMVKVSPSGKLSMDEAVYIWDAALEWSRPLVKKAIERALAKREAEKKEESPPPPKKPKKVKEKEEPFDLPEWIPVESWAGFEEMRKTIKAPLTARARQLNINILDKLKDQGESPGACLDQSVRNAWRGVFAVKENGATRIKKIEEDWAATEE